MMLESGETVQLTDSQREAVVQGIDWCDMMRKDLPPRLIWTHRGDAIDNTEQFLRGILKTDRMHQDETHADHSHENHR